MKSNERSSWQLLAALTTCAALFACGGGGDGGGGDDRPVEVLPPPPTPPPANTSPASGLVIPFVAGKRWLYGADFTNSVDSRSTGVTIEHFVGDRLLYVERQVTWGGRTAWRLIQLDVENDPGTRMGLQATPIYVAEGAEGLDRWVALGGGTGEWRRVLSTQSANFSNTALLLAGGPARQNRTQLTPPAPVTVPGGTYQAIRATHTYSLTGGLEEISETRHEFFADGVGPIGADWSYTYNNRDPGADDSASNGVVLLKAIDFGPNMRAEVEPNDDGRDVAAQTLAAGDIVFANAQISDPGRIVADANVVANTQGLKLLQDWYRFTNLTTRQRRIALSYEVYDAVAQRHSDLDLYLFREEVGGALTCLASSKFDPTTVEGSRGEWIIQNLAPGSYYVAVQAWDTPAGAVPYWLNMR